MKLSGLVHHATNKQEEITAELVGSIQDKFKDVTGLKKRKLAAWIKKQSSVRSEYNQKDEKIELSPFEAAYWWAVNRRGELMNKTDSARFAKRMKAMGVDKDFIKQIEKTVAPEVLEITRWFSDTLGERVWEIVNPVHEARFGASMAHGGGYTPIA